MITMIDGKKHARLDVVLYEEALLAHVQAEVDLDNGSIGVLGDYVEGEREIKKLDVATETSTKEELVLVSAPELIYNEDRRVYNQLKNFYNTAGDATRAYYLKNVKRFRISEEGLDGLDAISDLDMTKHKYYIVPQASNKMKIVEDVETNAIGKLVRVDKEGLATYYDATTKGFMGNTYDMYVIDVL